MPTLAELYSVREHTQNTVQCKVVSVVVCIACGTGISFLCHCSILIGGTAHARRIVIKCDSSRIWGRGTFVAPGICFLLLLMYYGRGGQKTMR